MFRCALGVYSILQYVWVTVCQWYGCRSIRDMNVSIITPEACIHTKSLNQVCTNHTDNMRRWCIRALVFGLTRFISGVPNTQMACLHTRCQQWGDYIMCLCVCVRAHAGLATCVCVCGVCAVTKCECVCLMVRTRVLCENDLWRRERAHTHPTTQTHRILHRWSSASFFSFIQVPWKIACILLSVAWISLVIHHQLPLPPSLPFSLLSLFTSHVAWNLNTHHTPSMRVRVWVCLRAVYLCLCLRWCLRLCLCLVCLCLWLCLFPCE